MILKPGMFVRLQILYTEHTDAVTVPVAALVKREGNQGVFQVDVQSQKARFVPVSVGIVQQGIAEILTPDLEGEVVILGNHLLEEGTAVLLPDTAKERPAPVNPDNGTGQR